MLLFLQERLVVVITEMVHLAGNILPGRLRGRGRRGLLRATNTPTVKEGAPSGYKHTHSQGGGFFGLKTHRQSRRGFLRATNTSTVKEGVSLG